MNKDFEIKQGTDYSFILELENFNSVIDKMFITLKTNYTDTTSSLTLDYNDGITPLLNNKFRIELSKHHTTYTLKPSIYLYELTMSYDGVTKKPLTGKITITPSLEK